MNRRRRMTRRRRRLNFYPSTVTPKLALTTLQTIRPEDLPTSLCKRCGSNRIVTKQLPTVVDCNGLTLSVIRPVRHCTPCALVFTDHVSDAVVEEAVKQQVRSALPMVTDQDLEREVQRREAIRAAAEEAKRIYKQSQHLPNIETYLKLVPDHDRDGCNDTWLAYVHDGTCRRCALLHARRSQYWPITLDVTFTVTTRDR